MRKVIADKQFDNERALYNTESADINNCVFAGPADGESVLKESRDINVSGCSFSLRYPLWHVKKFSLNNSVLDELTRAPIWYSFDGKIDNCNVRGVKAVRECNNIDIKNSFIDSTEFGWKSNNITLTDSDIISEYLFFDTNNVTLKNVKMKGKYSFQYMNNLTIDDCFLDTKDAFWHSKNVTVRNSVVKGEYLAWFSENLTLVNCRIIGTQPLCYCKGLKLVDCTMEGADFAFEYSEVDATIKGDVISIKNPLSGKIVVNSVGEIIREDAVMECTGEVIIR